MDLQRTPAAFVLVCLAVVSQKTQALEAVLMDTRTATSEIGWTMSRGSEWQDVSSNLPDGSERRMLMVCKIRKAKQNNWVRSPYIPTLGAHRIYIEFEFTMRSCDEVSNVASCKETFNLFYFQTDDDEATSTFPPWQEGAYVKVDTIAADKRFHSGSTETNFETRDIGPLTGNGVYIALQDTGACMALMHVRVYYKYCAPTAENLARFPRTFSGPERTSLVASGGVCVPHSEADNDNFPTLHCNSEGEWNVPKGQCLCGSGYAPSSRQTSCKACGRGYYKASVGNEACRRCPAYSHSRHYGAKQCDCNFGYFRTDSDGPTSPCTKSPSEPTNLQTVVNQTRVYLRWERPLTDGGRDEISYRVECLKCLPAHTSCASCSSDLTYLPMQRGLEDVAVEIRHLSLFSYYKFKVFAENEVTPIAGTEGSFAEISVETTNAVPSEVRNVRVVSVSPSSFVVTWSAPSIGGSDVELYEVTVTDYHKEEVVFINVTSMRSLEVANLTNGTDFIVEVRAKASADFGPFSESVKVRTIGTEVTPPSMFTDDEADILEMPIIISVGLATLIVAVIIVAVCCKRRTRRKRQKEKSDLGLEKYPMFRSNTLLLDGGFASGEKTYIDPTTYEDPHRAVLDFTKEIEAAWVSIEEVIGGGEFGEVCRGHVILPYSKTQHEVAIKTLKTGYSTQQKLDFLGEASIMGQFEHPNVIQLGGVVTRSRPLMIITEYMENGSLDAFLRKHDAGFSVVQLVMMLRNIAAGMKYLSEMGYVHRDLAARNVLVNAQLVCKVSDFGLSRVLEDDDATYTTRGGKIPIRWTAPEAITYRKFTSASDVWSFGIVIWEVMSYGERPYWGMSNQDVIQAVGNGFRLPAPMDCPQVQHQLMVDCWKKNRNERPKFADIVTSLDRMLRDPSQLKPVAGKKSSSVDSVILVEEPPSYHQHEDAPLLESQSSFNIHEDSSKSHLQSFSVEMWLVDLGLLIYKNNFISCGYNGLEEVIHLQPSDMTRLCITNTNHCNTLLESVACLRDKYHCSKGEMTITSEAKQSAVPPI